MGEPDQIRRAQAGDRAAMGELFETYRVRAFRAAFLITRDRMLSEDMTQEAFVRAYQAVRRCDPERPFLPWLLRILINLCRNAMKRQRRVVSLPDPSEVGMEEAGYGAAEERIVVWCAIMGLDPVHREVLMLRYYHDLPDAEMAEALGIPVGTVKSRLHAARHLLEQQLGTGTIEGMAPSREGAAR